MSTIPTVDYDKFIALNQSELCAYMEPLVGSSLTQVSGNVLARMLAELTTYDEYHLAYALALGVKQSPKIFALHLPPYLAHSSSGVCCTALNGLDQLPDEFITPDLVNSVRKVIAINRVRQFVTELPDRLEKRLGGS